MIPGLLRVAGGLALRAVRPMAFLRMFEPMKKPSELHPVFKLPSRNPGHM
jgi:ribosomal protein L35